MKKISKGVFLFFLLWIPLMAGSANRPLRDFCHVYGTIYIEKKRNMADYLVYVEKEEAFADLLIFKEDSRVYADRQGKWFITSNRGFADYTIFLEENRGSAHFTIFYTEIESIAGCR